MALWGAVGPLYRVGADAMVADLTTEHPSAVSAGLIIAGTAACRRAILPVRCPWQSGEVDLGVGFEHAYVADGAILPVEHLRAGRRLCY